MFSSSVRFYFCHFCLPLCFSGRANYNIFNELVLNLMTLGGICFEMVLIDDLMVRQTGLLVRPNVRATTQIPIVLHLSWPAPVHPAVSSLEACPTPALRVLPHPGSPVLEGRHLTTLNRKRPTLKLMIGISMTKIAKLYLNWQTCGRTLVSVKI